MTCAAPRRLCERSEVTEPVPHKSLLHDPLYRRLWTTVELSFLGGFVHVVACGWLIAQMSDNATLVALTQTAYSLPLVFFSMFSGALADIYDQRKTMIWALGISIVASALLAGAAALEMLQPWSMLALLFAVGGGVAIFTPSWQASLGTIVERDRLTEAVSLHNMGANVMRTIGPTLGGMLITYATATLTFLLGAITYLPALVTLMRWKPAARPAVGTRESIGSAMGSGVRFLIASPHLQPILLRAFCFSLGAVSVNALLPLIVRDQLGGDAADYGILFGAFGLGAILGGFALRPLRLRHDNDWIVRRAFVINALAILGLATSHSFVPGMIATVIAGACWLTVHSMQNTTLQLSAPRWIVGRMVSMFLTATFLGLSVGSWMWGVITDYSSTETALIIAAAAMALTYLAALRFPLPETGNLHLEPLDSDAVAPPPARLSLHTGPIQILLEHRLADGKLPEFRTLMAQRRRHLARLGARHWTLVEEIATTSGAAPNLWIESFQLPTWADYQRLMLRRTAETVALRDDVRRLQQDGLEPAIRRFVVRSPGPQHNPVMLRT